MALTKEDKNEIGLMIAEAIIKANNGVPAKLSVTPDPKFDPKGKYEPLDIVTLMPTEGNPFHKQGEQYEAQGHQATMQIKKGLALFIEVKEKYVAPKHTGIDKGPVTK